MTKILPTVGRVLWFTPSSRTGYGFTQIDSRKPLAAIVTHVFHDTLVNLSVFDRTAFPIAGRASGLCRKARTSPNTAISVSGCRSVPGRAGAKAAAVLRDRHLGGPSGGKAEAVLVLS